MGEYTSGRLVLLGSVYAVTPVGVFVIAPVWRFATYLIGRIAKFVRGSRAEALGALLGFLAVFGALALSGVVGLATTLAADTGPRYFLDVPGTSSHYLVTIFTFGETSLTLHQGNGTAYERLKIYPPIVDRSIDFASNHHVDTNASGRSFLIYPQKAAGKQEFPYPSADRDKGHSSPHAPQMPGREVHRRPHTSPGWPLRHRRLGHCADPS